MASLFCSVLSIALLLLNLSSLVQSAGIVTYWGTSSDEGTLAEACATGNYAIINIGFLNSFGSGREPSLDLGGHCDPRPPSNNCTSLSNDIISCQNQGIKVLLSLGGPTGSYSLASADEARDFATYLWNNFLGGESNSRPLGDAILDGIDFDIESGNAAFWDDLARSLAEYRSHRNVLLSAAPGCSIPDPHLTHAIETKLFDYIWQRYYNNEKCQYYSESDDSIEILVTNYLKFISFIRETQVFMGLPAAPDAAQGFIPYKVLVSQVLPRINSSTKYGGIMLWNRFFDKETNYSTLVKGSISSFRSQILTTTNMDERSEYELS